MAPVKNYSPFQMGQAMEAVRKGQNVSSAAKKYGVPRITLRNKITGKSPAVCAMGPATILRKEEEEILVQWLFGMSERHCPVSKEQLLDSVQMILQSSGKENPFTDNRPGRKWYEAFLRRHPQVSERVSQNLGTSREAVTEEQITKWFSEVQKYINDNDLNEALQDPARIYNTDESAFFLNPKPGRVLAKKGDTKVYSVSGNEKENLTVLITANAAGQLPPPMIVYTYERIPKHVADSVPDSWAIGKSESGWMCSSTFYEYMTNVFHPWLLRNKIKLPVIFFLDGHASHLTKHLSDFCSENKIEVIALYPNSTHLLQPMDLAVFKPLKTFWRKQVRKWRAEKGQQVRKENFATVLKPTLDYLTQDSIKNGFRAGGLFPFGPEYVDFSKMHAHNRKLTKNEAFSTQDSEFLAKLEQEIVKIFTVSKLDMFKKYFYTSKNILHEILPAEDLTLYTIWAKYKHLCYSNRRESDTLENQEALRELAQTERDTDHKKTSDNQNETHKNQPVDAIICNSPLKTMPSTPFAETFKDTDTTVLPHTSEQPSMTTVTYETRQDKTLVDMAKKALLNDVSLTSFAEMPKNTNTIASENLSGMSLRTDSNDTHQNQKMVVLAEKTPLKDITSTTFAGYMLKEKNITISTPFKKALFWPDPIIKKKTRMSKEKLPSAITSKAWKEFHEKKELEKKRKEEEKEKRKQDRIEKKAKKDEQIKNKNSAGEKPKSKKRRKQSVTSSDDNDSDITYMESGESDIDMERNSENDSEIRKTWQEFHEKKELEKKRKEEEKEKRKQDRIEKKAKKDEQIKNQNPTGEKLKSKKRRKQSVTSSDDHDSDITYMESGESDIDMERNSENDLENSLQTCNIEQKRTTETFSLPKDTEENNKRRRDKKTEEETVRENVLTKNEEQKVKILDNVDMQELLDDKTGEIKVTPKTTSELSDMPEEGKYVLVKFDGKNTNKTYRYVCMIKDIFGDVCIVQGLQSKKSKNTYKLIEDDVSIIDKTDILRYLPMPVEDNDNFVFPCVIDVKELIK